MFSSHSKSCLFHMKEALKKLREIVGIFLKQTPTSCGYVNKDAWERGCAPTCENSWIELLHFFYCWRVLLFCFFKGFSKKNIAFFNFDQILLRVYFIWQSLDLLCVQKFACFWNSLHFWKLSFLKILHIFQIFKILGNFEVFHVL